MTDEDFISISPDQVRKIHEKILRTEPGAIDEHAGYIGSKNSRYRSVVVLPYRPSAKYLVQRHQVVLPRQTQRDEVLLRRV